LSVKEKIKLLRQITKSRFEAIESNLELIEERVKKLEEK